MPVKKLREFLDRNSVKYVSVSHSPAYTAQEIAESANIQGKDLAKTVIVDIDGRLAMAVVPATKKVDIEKLKRVSNGTDVSITKESDFKDAFPECEVGAMPPFGSLYDMDTFVDESLTEDPEIAFNAGTHTELIKMPLDDFIRLADPKMGRFTV